MLWTNSKWTSHKTSCSLASGGAQVKEHSTHGASDMYSNGSNGNHTQSPCLDRILSAKTSGLHPLHTSPRCSLPACLQLAPRWPTIQKEWQLADCFSQLISRILKIHIVELTHPEVLGQTDRICVAGRYNIYYTM